VQAIDINKVYPNPDQPRQHFDPVKLEELSQSIEKNGLIEPIIVTKRNDKYMIIAGERRWRAHALAGLAEIKAEVMNLVSEQTIAELALLENLQREDLNIIEEARAYQNLLNMGMTQEKLAEKMGISQPWRIQERLNLLKLRTVYQDYVLKNILTPSQAYEMSRVEHQFQDVMFNKIRDGKLKTYNELRSFTNAIVYHQEQRSFISEPSKDERKVKDKYDRMIEKLLKFINGSFNPDDLSILRAVVKSSLKRNIEQIDEIILYLNKVKKAMVQAESKQQLQQTMEV